MEMPPPPPNHHRPVGSYPDVPYGVIDEDELVGIVPDPADDRDNYKAGKKKKGDKGDDKDAAKTFRAYYEGYTLERIKTGPGDALSWQRCGRTKLPLGQESLVALVKKHRKETRARPAGSDFKRLSSDKQRIINRIIEEKQQDETSKTAEWTLVDVQQLQRPTGFISSETYKLQVVIKRTDKGSDKNGTANPGTHSYPASDVIDLNVPLKKKDKKDGKKNKQNPHSPDRMDPHDDPRNYDNGPMEPPPDRPPPQDFYPQDPWAGQQLPPQAPMPPPPPQLQQNPFNAQFDPHVVDPYANQPGSARDFNNNTNPYIPPHNVIMPDQNQQQYPHPHPSTHERSHTRSRSRRQHSHSHSRPRHYRRSDSPVEEITGKMHRMWSPHGSSRASTSDDRSTIFSRDDYRRGYSPDTSVDSYDHRYDRHDRRYSAPRPRYRSKHYRDTDIEPGYTTSRRHDGDRRYSRDFERRPPIPRAITYDSHDDYPDGRGIEQRPRVLPPAEGGRGGMQRRYTAAAVFPDRREEYFADREREKREIFNAGLRQGKRDGYYYD